MAMNAVYRGPADLPDVIPVFPLPGALLLPRGQLPLNIFEPRYLAMIDDALASGHRIIGMVQPVPAEEDAKRPTLADIGCAGRITQFSETGDGRYMLSLTGIARFRIVSEVLATTPYRQAKADFQSFAADFEARVGEEAVDRDSLLKALKEFLEANNMEADWDGIRRAPTEALVNALCMMSPWGVREKQALLEAPDLKTRAALLVAVTEVALAKDQTSDEKPSLN
ncbi:LON peptidase substrate-binding domain-containing protein [Phreatobacter sp. AB_2022a]|uniref:LON peptidase substrate-binding domain-containing protein n=1 Tax=Phreatobacter sp. AB_2022a TaxID=3003134 RepID=UPI002286E95D|nr:LON peptidase substrate-binding domain-containing protein [Phreatobacter sp. AB_2022a]MCZ0737262.1 LON peptidase substrate-binding domain-containing protein [Phreatobacter sp. AB_2022a]